MPPSHPVWTARVRREVLPNGLTLLVQPDHAAPVVAVVTHVKAGFFDEPDHWVGISHVLEHMFFKGTARRGVGAVARETKSAGGYLNASTSYDHTSYFTVLPASGFDAALDIQSDALRNSAIDPGEVARELQVIIQEAKRKLDTASAVAYETLHEVMFDRHRIRRWRIGRQEQLERLTRDDLWSYYRSRYVPERTIVAIVGAVDADQALERARAAYGDWPATPSVVDPSPEEPFHREVRARTLRGDVTQAELALGWRAVPPLHPDATALDLAAAVLSSGRGSWLYRALREPGIATYVSAYNYAPTQLGVFGVTAELPPARLGTALDEIAGAVGWLTGQGPTDEELERARTLVRARWARRLEATEGRAAALAAAEALEDFGLLDREYEALGKLGPDDVQAAAARYLHPGAVAGVAYLPQDEPDDLTAERLARSFAAATPAVAKTSPAPALVTPPPMVVHPGVTADVHHVALPGADLLVRRKPGVPLVNLGVYVPRARFEPFARAGLGALSVRSAARGAGDLGSGELASALEQLGGTLTASATTDWLGFATIVLSQHLAEAAALLDLVFTAPRLLDEEIAAERRIMVAEAEQVADDMFRYPFQLAFAEAFGDEGYGLPVGGWPQTVSAITGADVRAWYRLALQEPRPVVVAVGDVEPAHAAGVLAGVFGGRLPRLTEAAPAPGAWRAGGDGGSFRVVGREKAQAALAMVFPGPTRRAADRTAARVWASVATGLGGRLFDALRDRRSLAYTVVASSWQKASAGSLVTYIATSPEREEEARTAMLAELARFATEPVTREELAQAVNYLAGQAEVNRQSGAAVAGEILEAWIAGTGLEELADPGAAYRRVTAAEVQRVAETYLDPARRAEGVVRGTGLARSPVAALQA